MAIPRLPLVMALLTPIAALAVFQGLVTAGLLPLAVFGPLYAVGRAGTRTRDAPRIEGARAVAAASIGAGFAFATVLLFLNQGVDPLPDPFATAGLFLIAAALGTLVGLTTAPPGRSLSVAEQRRWVFVEALDHSHARGLAMLFFTTLLAAGLLALLRDAAVFPGPDGSRTLPAALFGSDAVSGYALFPSATATWVVALPLTLAPLALGALLPVRSSFPLALGGLALLALMPVAVMLDLPVETPGGSFVALSLRTAPAFDAALALAPAGAGALLGVGLVTLARAATRTRVDQRGLWVLGGAVLVLATHGLVPGLAIVLGVLLAAAALTWPKGRPLAAAALLVGAAVGLVAGQLFAHATALAVGALVGIVVGSAVTSAGVARALPLPRESIRSIRTLLYLGPAAVVAGLVAWSAARALAGELVPFEAPHARALAAGLDAAVTARSPLLLGWGLAAGVLLQLVTRRGATVALGFLAGPTVALLVLVGSLWRSWWESRMLQRAQDGYVMRGELGYNLLRLHAMVVAVLAGEAVVVGLKGWVG